MAADLDLLYLEAANYSFIMKDKTTRQIFVEIAENYRKLLQIDTKNLTDTDLKKSIDIPYTDRENTDDRNINFTI